MATPANPLDNQTAIAQINNAISFLITEFLRPTALQTRANADALNLTHQAIDQLTADLQTTRRVVDDLAAESAADGRRATNNSSNIENLLAESREDRRRSDQRFAEERRLSDEKNAEERRLSDQRFEESNRRFEAQQEVLQRMLLEVRSVNGAVAGLSDRVDSIERAS